MRKILLPLLVIAFFPFSGSAQESKPLIRFSPFFTKGISVEETSFIESLVQSYLSDFGEVVNFFDNAPRNDGGFLPGSWTRAPDYVVTGSIYLEEENRILTLEIHSTVTKETKRSTAIHRTAGDMALKVRSLVETAFASPSMTESVPGETLDAGKGANPETITERNIIGAWRGETGIEMIRLQQGGRGVAFFSSGAQMNLSYAIENNTLKIRQDSPNTERFYYPLPYGVAKQMSAEAGPMSWELYLYSGGTHLRGVKISTEAAVEGNLLVELLPNISRDTEWTRSR